nr:MAG TPA: hypothetical protein [Caudoviricetes sp.]
MHFATDKDTIRHSGIVQNCVICQGGKLLFPLF